MSSHKTILVLALIGALALAIPASAQESTPSPSPNTNIITVSGEGTAYAAPDVAYVQLGVATVDPDLATAFSKTGQTISDVLKALKEVGIADADIQTSGINVSPQNQFDNNGNPSGTPTYSVSNTVQVTVRKIDQVEAVLTAAVGAGANTIYNLNFDIQDSSALEQQARTQAVQQAHDRAQQLATLLGVTLGKPITVTETPQNAGPVPFVLRASVAGGGGGQPVSSGQLGVTVDVQITYSIS